MSNYTTRVEVSGTWDLMPGDIYSSPYFNGNGGAMILPAANASLQGDGTAASPVVFTGNSSVNGGAIYSNGTITVSDNTIFADNRANGEGGAIYSNGALTVSGTTFSGNAATLGGAVRTAGTSNIIDAVMTANAASDQNKGGGALFNGGAATIAGGTFRGNVATNGGAIWNHYSKSVNVTSTLLSGNTARNGGGLYNSDGATATLTGATFSGNTAAVTGGAIYDNSKSVTVQGGGFLWNISGEEGGAIYHAGGTLTVNGATFHGNTAATMGGAVRTAAVAALTDVVMTGNTSGTRGGALFNGNTATITGGTFGGNISANGGAIWNHFNMRLNVSGALISGNSATAGGGLYNADGATATVSGATFSGNRAVDGGAVNNYNGTTTVSGNAIFVDNTATNYGGAINNNKNLTVAGLFLRNTATSRGGAIYNDGGNVASAAVVTTITGGTFRGNRAATGGAVFNNGGTTTVGNQTVFTSNVATEEGGAIYNAKGLLSVTGATFSGNTAAAMGGAIRNADTTTLADVVMIGNTSGTRGGALFNGGTATIAGGTFAGNISSNGGAIWNHFNVNARLEVSNVLFSGNTASSNGGALYNTDNSTAVLTGTTFSGNRAADGGAIGNVKTATVTITNSTFATASDAISNNGALTFSGVNRLNAGVSGTGTNNVAANGALIFGNTAAISVAGLTFAGSNAVTFAGTAVVNFTSQDLSGVSITVGTGNLPAEGASFTIASGVSAMNNTITVGGETVTLGEAVEIGGGTYTYTYAANALTVSQAFQYYDKVAAAPAGTTSVVIGGTLVTLEHRYDTVTEASSHLNPGGQLIVAGLTFGSGNYYFSGNNDVILAGGANITSTNLNFAMDSESVSGDLDVMIDHSIIPNSYAIAARATVAGEINVTLNGATATDRFSAYAGAENEVFCTGVNYTITDSLIVNGLFGGGSDTNPTIDGDVNIILTGSTVGGEKGVTGSRGNNVTGDIFITLAGSTVSTVRKHDDGKTNVDADLTLTVTGAANSVIGSLSDVDKLSIGTGSSVTFTTAQDLSATTLSVDGSAYAGVETTVASNVSALGSYTVTGADPSTFLKVADGNLVMYTRVADVDDSVSESSYTGTGTCLMTGGTITGAFVGIRNPAANADVKNVISGGTIGNALIGGALVSSGSTATLDTVTLDIAGNAQIIGGAANGGMVYTAGYAYGTDPNVLDSSATLTVAKSVLNLSAGSVPAQNLYAGAHARKGAYTVVGKTEINVTGGSFGRIYGGGWAEKVGKSEVGSSTISVSGGIVDYIYAGGGNAEGGTTVVTGNVSISVSGDASVGIVFLAGKNINCTTEGAVTMTVSGIAKSMSRVSGWNANGRENPSLTTLDLRTSLDVEYLDHVDVVRIAEGSTLNVSADLWYEAADALKIDFDLDGALDTDWTAMSGVGMDIYRAAQYTIDGGSTVYSYDSESGKLVNGTTESGYGLTFTSDNKVKFVTIA